MRRDQKSAVVDEIATQINQSEAIYAADYRGISVSQAAELRAVLREADSIFRIVKNTLTLLAADKAGAEDVKQLVEGPTAFTFVRGDPAQAAKALDSFSRKERVLEVRGGLMAGELLSADAFKQLARLPGRDQLNAQLAWVVGSPLTGLVRGLGALLSGLAIALGQVRGIKEAEEGAQPKETEPAATGGPQEPEVAEESQEPETQAEPETAAEEPEEPEAAQEPEADTEANEKEAG
jgi:large subunit ribosomal protein L10